MGPKLEFLSLFQDFGRVEMSFLLDISVTSENPKHVLSRKNRWFRFSFSHMTIPFFEVILMVKFWWLDPDLKNLLCRVRLDDHGELIGTLQQLTSNGDLQLRSKDGRLWTLLRGREIRDLIEARGFPFGKARNVNPEL